jgi:radical SAM protein with 4Fe4S-binding SPASM domain
MNNNNNINFHNKHEEFTQKAYISNEILLPDRYVFVLTNQCNLRCPFCFQEKKFLPNAMTLEDWKNLVAQLPDYARVTLTGGEPLMFKGFKELFELIAKKYSCNIISNGIMLTENIIDFILSFENFKVLSISIDDIGNRERNVSEKQWNHLINMINYFHKKKNELSSNCILDIKTMVLDNNANNLFEIREFCYNILKCDTQSFQFLKGSKIQHADYSFSFDDIIQKSNAYIYKNFDKIKQEIIEIKKHKAKTNSRVFLHPKIELVEENPNELSDDFILYNKTTFDKDKYEKCMFPWSSVHINFDGTLFPCLNVSMGNVKKQQLKDIIKGEQYNKFRKLIKEKGTVEACNRCGWLRCKNISSNNNSNSKIGKVYILGNSGFIGKQIEQKLCDKYDVVGLDSKKCNLLNYSEIETCFKDITDNDIIVFTSSITRLIQNDFDSYNKNIDMSLNISKLLSNHPIKQLLFLSTIDVYGLVSENTIIDENTNTNPVDYYASSKLASEIILSNICKINNIPLTIFRLNGIWGYGDHNKSTINKILNYGLKNRIINIFGDGSNKRDFIHINDLNNLIEKSIKNNIFGLYNISKGKSHSIIDIVNKIKEFSDSNIEIVYKENNNNDNGRVKNLIFNNSKLKNSFNNYEFSDIFDELKKYIKMIKMDNNEIDLLAKYPKSKRDLDERASSKKEEQRAIARKFDKEFFDGDRSTGYGGFNYHPKFWTEVVKDFIEYYNLKPGSKILDVGCAKGFMLYDFLQAMPDLIIKGIDISKYAVENSKEEVREFLEVGNANDLSKFNNNEFDLVISINTVHNLPEDECKKAISEIERVGKNAFITMDAWNNELEKERMIKWNLTAKTLMSVEDWKKLFNEIGYTGNYYWFIP